MDIFKILATYMFSIFDYTTFIYYTPLPHEGLRRGLHPLMDEK